MLSAFSVLVQVAGRRHGFCVLKPVESVVNALHQQPDINSSTALPTILALLSDLDTKLPTPTELANSEPDTDFEVVS